MSAADPSAESANPTPATHDEVKNAVQALRSALDATLALGSATDFLALRTPALAAGEVLARMPRRPAQDPLSVLVSTLIRDFAAAVPPDHAGGEAALAQARLLAAQGWPGVLAATLLVPAWQWPDAPVLDTLPEWLWGTYATWLFATPRQLTVPGQAAAFVASAQPRLAQLARWVERNRGSAAVRTAVDAFLDQFSPAPLASADLNPRPFAEIHGRLLTLALRPQRDELAPSAYGRSGRVLRVGFVANDFASAGETCRLLPYFEQMATDRFEVSLFALQVPGNSLEDYCRQHAKSLETLPLDLAGQLDLLRAASLDVLVFACDFTQPAGDLVRLALHRLAPLQVATTVSPVTTGLPEIDLYLSGSQAAPTDAAAFFTERLGLLPGPAHVFNHDPVAAEAGITWAREALSLPESALVLVSAADLARITPETRQVWAGLLQTLPNARLLIHPLASGPVDPTAFCAVFDRELADLGIAGDRLVVSTVPLPTRADIQALISVGDIYLDTFPASDVDALSLALDAGLPVVTVEGSSPHARAGAALLWSLQLGEWVAVDTSGYAAIVARLASHPDDRAALRTTIETTVARLPLIRDTLAASDAFGDLVERAYDELAQTGHAAFRANRVPLVASELTPALAASAVKIARSMLAAGDTFAAVTQARSALGVDPAGLEARHVLGAALLAAGQSARARDYLFAAVQTSEKGSGQLWFDLARAFRQTGEINHALEALETSLRIDETQIEGWHMLAELAEAAGVPDLAEEARQVANSLTAPKPAVEKSGIKLNLSAKLRFLRNTPPASS